MSLAEYQARWILDNNGVSSLNLDCFLHYQNNFLAYQKEAGLLLVTENKICYVNN